MEDLLNRLIDWTGKQDESAVKRRMVDLLINLSASLIWFIAGTVVANYFEREVTTKTESQVRIKELQRALVSITPAHSNIRIAVRAATLRTAPKKSSAIIGYLNQGSIVFVVQKAKKLTQIEWMDPSTGQLLSGWISSKYLAANKQ